jgi:hypothetical protein
MTIFVTSDFKIEIYNNVITPMFPVLNMDHKKLLANGLETIIDVIAITFNLLNNKNNFMHQLKQNNYRDCKGLLLLLLPYISEEHDPEKNELYSLDQLYTKKKSDIDINKFSPKYIYTNIQYGRCDRSNPNMIKEIMFSEKHFQQNLILLVDTIRHISNKLYINWIDVLPIPINKLTSLSMYKGLVRNFTLGTFDDWNPMDMHKLKLENINGLYVGTVYEIITNYLYHNVKYVKWLIYDISIDGVKSQFPIYFILHFIFTLTINIYKGFYNQLPDDDRNSFNNDHEYLLNALKDGRNIKLSNVNKYAENVGFNINNEQFNKIITSITYFFNNSYGNIDKAVKDGYIKLPDKKDKENHDDDEDEDEDEEIKINTDIIRKSFETITTEHLYNFIKESIEKFTYTYYAEHITTFLNFIDGISAFENDKDDTKKASVFIFGQNQVQKMLEIKMTLKNIYNYSKSLCHYIKQNKFVEYPKYWKSLTKNQKEEIIDRLNCKTKKWFNISRYIKKTYLSDEFVTDQNIESINNQIHLIINK